ncbi:DUF6230 family protein [Streptomyces sp. H27-D2]|uniref:DUF6230 family protein n=1 Tax=Streptomyces sp. H27-D2 TaxID=3046304 RepID=UPI002DBB79F2|nr:DUF6230 family protein [Streptomyces sp. H27-D2]MEC4016288.1 DUF6230 family protein [Streptomyces sp. H27-D2]
MFTPDSRATEGDGDRQGTDSATGAASVGRRSRSHTDRRLFALLATVALTLSAGTLWATTAGAVPISFAVSGSTFQVRADHLAGTDAVQFASHTTDAAGRHHAVAVAGVGSAKITNLCQSAVAHTPLGDITLNIRSGEDHPVQADDMVIDMDRMEGDMTFGRVQMGRDAATLDSVPGAQGAPGTYGQQARTLKIDHLRLRAWSITAATFSLKDASMAVALGDHSCL